MSSPHSWKIAVPGKMILMGEYAVLDGAPAVAQAVNRHVVVRPGTETTGELVAIARRKAARHLGIADHGDFTADSTALHHGSRKLGLGSSAAVTVGAVSSVFHQAGLDLGDQAVRVSMWGIAKDIHDAFQGAVGSGMDIAASIFGGRLVLGSHRSDTHPTFSKWTPPAGVRWACLWTGSEASTPDMVAGVRRFRQSEPGTYAGLVARMGQVTELFLEVGSASLSSMLECINQYSVLMDCLGRASGVPIVDQDMSRLFSRIREAGGAAKPSGAGGGDLIIAAFPANLDIGGLMRDCQSDGFVPLDLEVDEHGVQVYPEPAVVPEQGEVQ